MPILSPLRRNRPEQADEEVGISSTAHEGRRWTRPFSTRNAATNPDNEHAVAIEMSAQTTQPAPVADPAHLDIEQGAVHHQRGASGRSILSNVSIPSLSALRQRDRDQERRRQLARAESTAAPLANVPQLDTVTYGRNAVAAVLLSPSAQVAAALRSGKKSRNSRREREEAATLFGPNLANYFGSGNSSSGAVSGSGAGAASTLPATTSSGAGQATSTAALPVSTSARDTLDTPTQTNDASYLQGSVSSRRARLGSRGRARGASLSGLSMMSLGAESVTSLGGVNTDRTADGVSAQGMMQGSTADLIDELTRQGQLPQEDIAMSEGVDINTLQRWIDRSTGVPRDHAGNDTSQIPGPPVCTTLQSYVNLKRNTLKLSVKPVSSREQTQLDSGKADLGPLGDGKSSAQAPNPDINLLRSQSSMSMLPSLAYNHASGSYSPGDALPSATHTLYFEYDCASPYASVQIFVRASRKHGSWLTYYIPGAETDTHNADGTAPMLALRGPPPHVLGWPVHVAKLKKGFGVGHTAEIPLDLKYYAPPKAGKVQPSGGNDESKDQPAHGTKIPEAVTPGAIPETPAFEFQRRLELDAEEAEEDARTNPLQRNNVPTSTAPVLQDINENPVDAAQADGRTAQPVIEEETKEQRLAREKAERETLKVAIVVEALDENGRPLREPNLQTSYLRLTSLPARKSVATRLAEAATGTEVTDSKERVWSSQVEGQEAEIGPHRFQLQELYGLSSKPPPVRAAPAGGEGHEDVEGDEEAAGTATAGPDSGAFLAPMDLEATNGTECLICLSSPPTTLLLPCTHGLCLECAVQLRDSVIGIRQSERRRGRTPRRKYACPVCRRAYTSMLHLSKADEKVLAHASGTHANA